MKRTFTHTTHPDRPAKSFNDWWKHLSLELQKINKPYKECKVVKLKKTA